MSSHHVRRVHRMRWYKAPAGEWRELGWTTDGAYFAAPHPAVKITANLHELAVAGAMTMEEATAAVERVQQAFRDARAESIPAMWGGPS